MQQRILVSESHDGDTAIASDGFYFRGQEHVALLDHNFMILHAKSNLNSH